MTPDQPDQALVKKLEKHQQSHLIHYLSTLNSLDKKSLLRQIEALEWTRLDHWIDICTQEESHLEIPSEIHPAPYYPYNPTNDTQAKHYAQARQCGEELIHSGKVGAFVVAGGQGTRLGFEGPKGAFPASPIKKKSLFQLFCESLAEVNRRYQTRCPFYIMTSPLNHDQTIDFFEQGLFFGLHPDDVFIFPQGTLPNFSFAGKILMSDPSHIACSPDGHGGSLKALYQSGAVTDMANRGVELVSYWQVDNPLINPIDPLFIGLHHLDQAEMSSKALKKTGPLEKVGNFCQVNDKVCVIEYSDLPDQLAQQTRPDGSLLFALGSIGIHLINRSFIESLNADGFSLPIHRAVKKIPHINEHGQFIDPSEPNGVKLETFVFDALPLAQKSIILETSRAEEFAPIKNAQGVDSAESSRIMMIERAAAWLKTVGIKVPHTTDGKIDCILEIAPSYALSAADLQQKTQDIPTIQAGQELYLE